MKGTISKIYKTCEREEPLMLTEEIKKYHTWSNNHVLRMILIIHTDENRHG